MFQTIVVLTYGFIANIPLAKFSWLCYITLYNANSLKIPLNYVIIFLLVLFKVNAFPFKNKLLLCVARRHVCFVLKQSVTVTSLN
jgi:hypothetical protein